MRSGCTGALARSLAGHDRETLYIIIREEGEYVFFDFYKGSVEAECVADYLFQVVCGDVIAEE